ncbi:MAG: tetratricopeptide repeat protein [Planctomycetes bacterium]|nr:tetratricopeptide repeat protein [Planctomycetota bacterium]
MHFWHTNNRWRILAFLCLLIAAVISFCVYRLFVPSIAQLRQECLQAANAGQWKSVEAIATRWIRIAPNSGEPRMQLGESLFRQRKFQPALACYRSVPQTAPEAESAAISLMELQFGPLNEPIDGAITCRQLLARNPHSKVARQRLIFFLALTLQRTELVHQIRSAIESDSEPIEAYVYLFMVDSLMFSNGIEANSRWLRGDPNSELFEVAQAIFVAEMLDFNISLDDLAAAQAARRDAARKEEVLQKLLAKYPHNAELLAYTIQKLIQVGDVTAVVKLLAEATVECETDSRFWRYKGWVHVQRGELVDAQASYRRAIELNPLDWVTRHMLADVLQQELRFDEVKALRELTVRGRKLHNALRNAPSARDVPRDLLVELSEFSASCGDEQASGALRKRIEQDRGR